jgi:hypothetical protein
MKVQGFILTSLNKVLQKEEERLAQKIITISFQD